MLPRFPWASQQGPPARTAPSPPLPIRAESDDGPASGASVVGTDWQLPRWFRKGSSRLPGGATIQDLLREAQSGGDRLPASFPSSSLAPGPGPPGCSHSGLRAVSSHLKCGGRVCAWVVAARRFLLPAGKRRRCLLPKCKKTTRALPGIPACSLWSPTMRNRR